MADTFVNRLSCTISNAPGTSGNFVINAARNGARPFGATHDGLTFTVVIEEGYAWEIRTGCTYTQVGTTLSRGTLNDSSTGSAVSFTAAAIVTVTIAASQLPTSVSGAGNSVGGVYDPATLSATVNIPVTYPLVSNQTVDSTRTTAISRVSPSTGATWHYNLSFNSAGQLLSVSAWGPGATGQVGGY